MSDAYTAAASTLCAGCGHDAVSRQIIEVCREDAVPAWRVAKFGGIGCAAKTPAYFLGQAHGFHGAHGRMPAIATGALLANRELIGLGVSGDGDTLAIGLGQFLHLVRRNVPMVYLLENNGVYGLTKGQPSASADKGSRLKRGAGMPWEALDPCALALEAGGTFVARAFAGDPRQLRALLRAALAHHGTALIDVISPCVAFNNQPGSTKGFAYGREREERLHDITLGDGSTLQLEPLAEDFDVTDREAARALLARARARGRFITGLLHLTADAPSLHDTLALAETPLARLSEEELRPRRESFKQVLAAYR